MHKALPPVTVGDLDWLATPGTVHRAALLAENVDVLQRRDDPVTEALVATDPPHVVSMQWVFGVPFRCTCGARKTNPHRADLHCDHSTAAVIAVLADEHENPEEFRQDLKESAEVRERLQSAVDAYVEWAIRSDSRSINALEHLSGDFADLGLVLAPEVLSQRLLEKATSSQYGAFLLSEIRGRLGNDEDDLPEPERSINFLWTHRLLTPSVDPLPPTGAPALLHAAKQARPALSASADLRSLAMLCFQSACKALLGLDCTGEPMLATAVDEIVDLEERYGSGQDPVTMHLMERFAELREPLREVFERRVAGE